VNHKNDPADHLDQDLDRLARGAGQGFTPNGHFSETTRAAETCHALDASDPSADPRPAFLVQLKEQLELNAMDTVLPFPDAPFSTASAGVQRPRAGVRPIQTLVRPLRHPAIGGIATAALLVVTLVGAYFAFLGPQGESGGTPTVPAVAPAASPSPDSAESYLCESADPYFGCAFNALRLVGSGGIWSPNLSDAAREARQVQLQGWAVAPGSTITGIDGSSETTGVVVDVVLSGIYVATFDVPVVVNLGGITEGMIQYLDPGTTVELGSGDAVTYQLGGLTDLHNPLSVRRLEFKRAVVYEGDISAFSTTTDGVTTRVEGDNTLPQAIGSFRSEAIVQLWYIHVLPGTTFPPTQFADDTIIGPVDSQRGPASSEGFVLVIGPSAG
jgi:hypothetical protein